MARLRSLVLFGFIVLLLLLLLYVVYDPTLLRLVNQQRAFAQAKKWCTQPNMHLDLLKKPHGVNAELLTCKEIIQKTTITDCGGLASDKKGWLVTMEGKWNLWGPLKEDGTNTPIPLSRCVVIIDLKTGDGLNGYWGE